MTTYPVIFSVLPISRQAEIALTGEAEMDAGFALRYPV
jgi:hypothetical protein